MIKKYLKHHFEVSPNDNFKTEYGGLKEQGYSPCIPTFSRQSLLLAGGCLVIIKWGGATQIRLEAIYTTLSFLLNPSPKRPAANKIA